MTAKRCIIRYNTIFHQWELHCTGQVKHVSGTLQAVKSWAEDHGYETVGPRADEADTHDQHMREAGK